MTTKRISTVHDLASLRLHPDGTRVNNSASNVQPRKAKYVAKDNRGNWIAEDAGGLGRVKTRRLKKAEGAAEDEGHEPSSSKVSASAEEQRADRVEEEHEGEPAFKDRRAKQRRAFQDDFDFLNSPGPSTQPQVHRELSARPQPSSDLLKCIHHFASTYYTEMGQLRDSSREFRKEKKRRKLQKLTEATSKYGKKRERVVSEDEEDSETDRDEEADGEGEEKSVEEDGEQVNRTNKVAGAKRKRQRDVRRQIAHAMTDMYKICDGSALMAIGMLLQQHIADVLTTRVPAGWEDAMLEHGRVPIGAQHLLEQESGAPEDNEEEEDASAADDDDDDDDETEVATQEPLGLSDDDEYIPD